MCSEAQQGKDGFFFRLIQPRTFYPSYHSSFGPGLRHVTCVALLHPCTRSYQCVGYPLLRRKRYDSALLRLKSGVFFFLNRPFLTSSCFRALGRCQSGCNGQQTWLWYEYHALWHHPLCDVDPNNRTARYCAR
jgi:hypothetical protein